MPNYIKKIVLPNKQEYSIKDNYYQLDGTYNASSNKIATQTTVTSAINSLGSAARTSSSAYATAAQGILATEAMPKSGGTFTGDIILKNDPTTNLMAATKQYVDNNVSIDGVLTSGTQIGILTINGVSTKIYTPNAAPMTVQVNPASNTPTAEFIVSTNTEESNELTGVLGSTDTISDGKIIYYMTKYALPPEEITMKLKYSSSSNYTNSIPIYSYGNIRSTTPYPASYILTLIYYDSKLYIASTNLAVVQ